MGNYASKDSADGGHGHHQIHNDAIPTRVAGDMSSPNRARMGDDRHPAGGSPNYGGVVAGSMGISGVDRRDDPKNLSSIAVVDRG